MELASLAQLERSHRRHDDVMASLLEAARRLAAGRADANDVKTVHDAVAYFQRAVTRHFLDEEGSVFPRLSTRRPDLAANLASLSAEHPIQIAIQMEVAAAAREIDGESRPSAGMALLDATTRLADAHRAHVAREDNLFKLAQGALTIEDDVDIVAEMETRRDREGGGGGGGGGGRGRGMGGGGGGGGGGGRRDEGARVVSTRAPTIIASPSAIAKAAADAKTSKKAAVTTTKKPAATIAKKPAATIAKKPAATAAKKPAATAAKKPTASRKNRDQRAAKTTSKAAKKSVAKKPAKKPAKKSRR